MGKIPLFPLGLVLLPGMPLQLHIFEERYKLISTFPGRTVPVNSRMHRLGARVSHCAIGEKVQEHPVA